MLAFIVSVVVACIVGLVILGHILVLQALFTSADHADGKRERRKPSGVMPDIQV
jgi:hypothetical protein